MCPAARSTTLAVALVVTVVAYEFQLDKEELARETAIAEKEKEEKKDAKAKKVRVGRVDQIIGPVVDVAFESEQLPEIYHALEIDRGKDAGRLVLEVQQHRGNNVVRTIAMASTDGLVRGTEVRDTGQPITIPVGKSTLGRMMSVIGDPIDDLGHAVDPLRIQRSPTNPG